MLAHHLLRVLTLLALCLLMSGCAVDEAVQSAGDRALKAQVADWPDVPAHGDFAVYELNPTESWLSIIVLPDGRLARFGHPHVIGGELSGQIMQGTSAAWMDARVDVRALEVDRPEWRTVEGFEPELAADAIAGTRENMLSADVLDAEQFPKIELRAIDFGSDARPFELDLYIRLRDQVRRLRVPVQNFDILLPEGMIEVDGSFVMRQTDFGMQPFSALSGSLSVADALTIRFQIKANLTETEDMLVDE